MTHPASAAFPPVESLTVAELQAIIQTAPPNRLWWSAREKDAWHEDQRRFKAWCERHGDKP